MNRILGFFGNYRFLSNFWPANVEYAGVIYKTVEHAFQAAKTLDPVERGIIGAKETPGAAKKAGKFITLRSDWEEVKLNIMFDLVTAKFAEEPLRSELLSTGNAELVEDNNWGDTFWGSCDGVGQNHLGRILMKVRDNLSQVV